MYKTQPIFQYLFNSAGQVIGIAGDRLEAHHIWGRHVGTLNWDGRVWACSKKYNGVRLVSFEAFSGGKAVTNLGNIGRVSREDILAHYALLDSDGYGELDKNCEHIDNYVRGLGYKSPQIENALLVGFGSLLLAAALRS